MIPLTSRPKNGSVKMRPRNGSSKVRCSASETTSATEFVRRVTSDLAALGAPGSRRDRPVLERPRLDRYRNRHRFAGLRRHRRVARQPAYGSIERAVRPAEIHLHDLASGPVPAVAYRHVHRERLTV